MGEAISFERSWLFVLKCLDEYWAGCPFLIYFFIGLVWIYVFKKKTAARVFWYDTILLGLTVYNPLIIRFAVPRLVDAELYYRFFWILPVTIGTAYFFTAWVADCKKTWMKFAVTAVFMALIVTTSSVNGNVVYNMYMPENVYKVPDAVLYACDIIHRDYDGEGDPKAVFSDEYEIYVRQYDPSVKLTIDRNTRLYYQGSNVVGEVKENKRYKRKKRILDVINSTRKVSKRKFKIAMKLTKTDYIVVPEWYSCNEYLIDAGLEKIDQTGGICVYRFHREKQNG